MSPPHGTRVCVAVIILVALQNSLASATKLTHPQHAAVDANPPPPDPTSWASLWLHRAPTSKSFGDAVRGGDASAGLSVYCGGLNGSYGTEEDAGQHEDAASPLASACDELVSGLATLVNGGVRPEVVTNSGQARFVLRVNGPPSSSHASAWPPNTTSEGFTLTRQSNSYEVSGSSGPAVLYVWSSFPFANTSIYLTIPLGMHCAFSLI